MGVNSMFSSSHKSFREHILLPPIIPIPPIRDDGGVPLGGSLPLTAPTVQ